VSEKIEKKVLKMPKDIQLDQISAIALDNLF
jgi:hypothetical protein